MIIGCVQIDGSKHKAIGRSANDLGCYLTETEAIIQILTDYNK